MSIRIRAHTFVVVASRSSTYLKYASVRQGSSASLYFKSSLVSRLADLLPPRSSLEYELI